MDIAGIMSAFVGYVWSTPTALLLTGAGLLFTFLTLGIQFKALTHGIQVIRGKYDNPNDAGNISHFQALCAALSGTIGLGNISGVAIAIASGGPGAVFWMWVVGILGMATKFFTCSLSTMFREVDSSGTFRGGPMYYIEKGLGQRGSPLRRFAAKGLAMLFALLGVCGCIGAGTMFQSNQVAKIFVSLFKKVIPGGVSVNTQFTIQMIVGAVLCFFVALVIIGGIKRIGRVAGRLVPAMCAIYFLGAVYVIIVNLDSVPSVFASIFSNAFSPSSGMGAFYGVAVKTAIIQGVRRACFSNEAGMGTAPIAHATARTNEPIREGIVAAMGPFIDTIIVCTMTAMVILITNSHQRDPVGTITAIDDPRVVLEKQEKIVELDVEISVTDASISQIGETLFVHKPPANQGESARLILMNVSQVDDEKVTVTIKYADSESGRKNLDEERQFLLTGADVFLHRTGIELTAYSFDQVLTGFGTYFIPIAALLFAFSTMISWGFYGETCSEYLFGERAALPFKIAFAGMILVGTYSMELQPVIDWADGMLGLMMVPNMIGTLLLAPHVVRASRKYFQRLKAGEFEK